MIYIQCYAQVWHSFNIKKIYCNFVNQVGFLRKYVVRCVW